MLICRPSTLPRLLCTVSFFDHSIAHPFAYAVLQNPGVLVRTYQIIPFSFNINITDASLYCR